MAATSRHGVTVRATVSRTVDGLCWFRSWYIPHISVSRPATMQPAQCRSWRLHVLHQRPFEVQARKSRAACRQRVVAGAEQPSRWQPLVPIGQAAALAAFLHLAMTAGPSLAREAAGVVPLRRAVVEEMLVQQLADRVRQLSDSELAVALEQALSGQKQFPAELLLPHQQPAPQITAGNAAPTSSNSEPPTPPSQGLVPSTPSPPPSPLEFFQQSFSLWPSLQQPAAQQQQAAADNLGRAGSGAPAPQPLQGASPGSSSSTTVRGDMPADQVVGPGLPASGANATGASVAGKAGQQAEEVDLTQQLFERFAQLAEQQKQAGQQAAADIKPIPVDPGARAAGNGSSVPSGLAAAVTQPQLEAAVGSLGTWLGSPFAQVLLPRLVGGAVLVVLALSQLSKLLAWVAGSPSEQQGAAAPAAVDKEGEGSATMPPTPAAASSATGASTIEAQPMPSKQPFWASWLPIGGKTAKAEAASAPSAANSSGERAVSQQAAPAAVSREQPEHGRDAQPGSGARAEQPPTGVVWVRKEANPGSEQPHQQAPGNLPPPPPPTVPNGSNGGPASAFPAATQPAAAAGPPAGGAILWQRQTDSGPVAAEQQSSLSGLGVDPDGGSATSGGPQQPPWPAAAAEGETGTWLAAETGKPGNRVAPSGHRSLRDVDLWSLPLEELRGLKADDSLLAQDRALRGALGTQPAVPAAASSTAAAGAAIAGPRGGSAASPGMYNRGSPVQPQRGGAAGQGLPSRRHHSLLDNAEPADFAMLVPPARQSNG